MQLGVGAWNPRKRTAILLSFSTYTPDGLLFFVGKDRDQLFVELVDGRVSLSFVLGSGAVKLLSDKSSYNDGQWHMISIDRMERRAKLEVDGADVQEGKSAVTMFEASVSGAFYPGGLPKNVQTRFTVQPFRGCLKNLKLDTEYINLDNAHYSKGVQSSRPTREERLATLISERSQATLSKLSATKDVDLSLRFRTRQSTAHIASVTSNEEELLKIELDNGVLVVKSNGEEADVVRAEVPSGTEGRWHLISVVRTKKQLKVHLDDVFTKKIETTDLSDLLSSDDITVTLGHDASTDKHFIGCVGDVVFSGKLTSFANYEHKELKLTGCGLVDDAKAPTASTNPVTPEDEALEATAEHVRKLEPAASNVRPPGSCALPEVPYGEREDSAGMRFGLVQGSRLEYDRPPDSFDRNIVFSVQQRATAANGIIMFVTNEKHSDYIALYMIEGRIGFSLTILSKRIVLDDEWHTIRAEREDAAADLFADGRTEAESRVEGTETVDALAPLYIGGLPTDLLPLSSNILPGIKSELGGCLREFKLNDKKFDDTAREHGVVPCSQYTEDGLYFGKEGGYAVLQQEFVVGTSFAFEMEVKPVNAVLLSVGVLEFVTLQILKGTIKFCADSGGGTESVVYVPPVDNAICDGHWHQIKLHKKKNLITLNVDVKSNLRIMKAKTETSTKDPLFLGGVPKDVKRRGLGTVDPYIGCVRVLSIGKKTRHHRRNVDVTSIELFGMTDRTSFPLN